jgi:hypothetical protein
LSAKCLFSWLWTSNASWKCYRWCTWCTHHDNQQRLFSKHSTCTPLASKAPCTKHSKGYGCRSLCSSSRWQCSMFWRTPNSPHSAQLPSRSSC